MTCELLLLRHGKSDWSCDVDDFYRPLKNRGKRAAQRIGVWLQKQDLRPDFIISSSAERAINTAEKCCKAMEISAKKIVSDKSAYHASLGELLALIHQVPDSCSRLMLVGHNPGMEDLLVNLLGKYPPLHDDGKILPTGTLAHLSLNGPWQNIQELTGRLLHIVRGKELPKKFPYPNPHAKEMRERPAYYYSQSSAIPYRVKDRQLEILVIGSSGKKHRGIPKGIVDPGLSSAESAAKESWEEAGVKGSISQTPIGHYRYEKWGGECAVEVFALRVDEQVSVEQWGEKHRGREWLGAEEAKNAVKQKQLIPIIQRLQEKFHES